MIGEGGPGLGYHNLLGTFAIEFDFSIDWFWNDPGDSYAHLSLMRSDERGLLSSDHSYQLKSNKWPVNIANQLKPGFVQNPEVKIALVTHENDLLVAIGIDQIIQLEASIPLIDL